MRRRSQLIGGRAVPEVRVHDYSEPLHIVQVAIDGRDMDVGGAGLNGFGELFGGQVPVGVEEGLQYDPPRDRGPAPSSPHQGQDIINRRDPARRAGPGQGDRLAHQVTSLGLIDSG